MKRPRQPVKREITAIKVHQWLEEWEKVKFDPKTRKRKPKPWFYLFTLPASQLKALSGIQRRTTTGTLPRAQDIGIQRRHEEARSKEIEEFIQYGYPWSDLSDAKRRSGEFDDLRKPGWLPTAIVVNILKPGEERRGIKIDDKDIISVIDSGETAAVIKLPSEFNGSKWQPTNWPPIEIIDGQHRLWAFEGKSTDEDFELPVVAFHGLDTSWQAYLFWTINIKPKRINPSLAFDLYPLLRTEDWLEKFEGHSIYRETRAQELTEALWSHPESPWYQRINMLGESQLRQPMVTQAAWIRSLMASYVKSWEGRRVSIGGIFGSPMGSHDEVLPWSRAQQAAFLIFMGKKIQESIKECQALWAKALRRGGNQEISEENGDPAFYGPYTLLNTDQGIRGLLCVTNDLCYVMAEKLKLENWNVDEQAGAANEQAVSEAIKSLKKQTVSDFLGSIADGLVTYDWRTSAAPGVTGDDETLKKAFRGSGGYKELRYQLLKHLSGKAGAGFVGQAAKDVLGKLGYE